MPSSQRKVLIGQKEYWIDADPDYGKHLGDRFEPDTVALLECLISPDDTVLDIGANIGITGILLAQLSPEGKVVAMEPVPAAYNLLNRNVASSGHANIQTYNFALGKTEGEIVMQGNPHNLSGSFVSDMHVIDDGYHFKEVVKLRTLDGVFGSLGLDRLDLVKIDVEGYELDVLDGAASVLTKYRPIVTLEMNYVALNMWRKISVPEFRERLLDIFPHVYAINEGEYIDFRDEKRSHDVQVRHLTKWDFMDIVAGFDNDALITRLDRLEGIRQKNANQYSQQREKREIIDRLEETIGRLEEDLNQAKERLLTIEASHSWKITAPLRGLVRTFRKHFP